MLEAIQNAEHFLHDNRKKLTPEQIDEMQRRIRELRECYENMIGMSLEKLNTLRGMLGELESAERSKTELEQETKKRVEDLVQLLDWVAKIEHALGSEQPMMETTTPLDQQSKDHKV